MQLRNKILLIFAVIVAFFTIPSLAFTNTDVSDTFFTGLNNYGKSLNDYITEYKEKGYEYYIVFLNDGYDTYDTFWKTNNKILFYKEPTTFVNRGTYYESSITTPIFLQVSPFGENGVIIYENYTKDTISATDISLKTYSNFDIYDTNGTLVFQQPPQVIPVKTLEEVTLEAQLKAKEMTQETMKAELVELVPVGVAILATMILVSLVAYFPHWKG